jgi:hypothetical protein
MRKSTVFIVVLGLLAAFLAILLAVGHWRVQADAAKLQPGKRQLVSRLLLTDFSLFTEARYTRHPSQADIFSPFGEYPSSLEHFPAGSLLVPGQVRTAAIAEGGEAR